MTPKSATKAQLRATIERLQVEMSHLQRDRQSAWEDAGKARAETAEVLNQRPGLEDLRDLAKDLKLATDGDAVDVIVRIRRTAANWALCDLCGEPTQHHHCEGCFSDPRDALIEVLELLEEAPGDDLERRLQREMIERIAEEYTGQTVNLRRVS